MATYYGTYGQKVQYLASDPSDPQIGQVWYNSTSATLKVRQEVATNAWASGGNLGTARYFYQEQEFKQQQLHLVVQLQEYLVLIQNYTMEQLGHLIQLDLQQLDLV
jgi:hypothetical protein